MLLSADARAGSRGDGKPRNIGTTYQGSARSSPQRESLQGRRLAGMAWVVEGNALGFSEHGIGVLDPVRCAQLTAQTRTELCRQAARLDMRCRGGLVRECHGDLHLRNICLIDGAPTIFDGVDF